MSTGRTVRSWSPIVSIMALGIASVVQFGVAAERPAADGDNEQQTDPLVGNVLPDFTLKDFLGKEHALKSLCQDGLVVAYFLGTECPLAKLYGPRMQKLADRFADRDVTVIGISSNVQDSISELAAHARHHELRFPILKDLGNVVADQWGATRTPEVFVLDSERRVQYHGRVDAQFTFGSGVGLAQPTARRNDLAEAVKELLAGNPVTVASTELKGCLIGRVAKPKDDSPVTYSNQIARIIQKRCLECHREGQIAPFALSEYDEVAGWGEMMAEVVEERRMPPWHASPKHGSFVNENRLTGEEIAMIRTWVDNGCPEGDSKELPQPIAFHEGWFMKQTPDEIIYMTEEPVQVKSEGVEPYRYYEVDPGFTEDKWITLAECMPGNREVVHHIIVYAVPPGERRRRREFIAGFAPGTRPQVAPKGWAKRIPAGSKLLFELHYTPVGRVLTDRSSVGFVYCDESEVTHRLRTANAINGRFRIPAGASDHPVHAERTFRRDTVLLSLFPHMHLRGKSFRYELTYPDGRKETLLDVPRFDFNWQTSYIFKSPIHVPRGSRLDCYAIFDNSENNLANPDPTRDIGWGEQTWDEMMIGWYDSGYRLPQRNADAGGGEE